MNPDGFTADIHRKPELLRGLAATLSAGNPWTEVVGHDVARVVLLGMGSSAYAGAAAAARMRARGLVASSELASSRLLPAWGPGTLVVATSATGGLPLSQIGDLRFPSCCSAPPAPTSPRPRTGSVRRSRAR